MNKNKHRILSLLLALTMVFALLPGTALAANLTWDGTDDVTAETDDTVYVALGDSVPYGYGLANPAAESYVNLFAGMMEADGAGVTTFNQSVSGLTSAQLLAALSGLSAGDAALLASADVITLNIGGNDVLGTVLAYLVTQGIIDTSGNVLNPQALATIDLTALSGTLGTAATNFGANYAAIITLLKQAAPNAELIVSTIYNPIPDTLTTLAAADTFITAMNSVIWGLQSTGGYKIADTYTAFAEAAVPVTNVNLPYSVDIHPNAAGHELMAELHYAQWSGAVYTETHIAYLFGYGDGSVRPDKSITRAEAAAILYRVIEDEDKAAPLTCTFSDVKSGSWYYQAVAYLQKQGIISGYPDGTFKPESVITRAEFVTMIVRPGELVANAPSKFGDVSASHWAAKYINSAAAKGWVSGYPDGTFKPGAKLTRAEAVTIVNCVLGRKIKLENIPAGAPKLNDITSKHWAYCDIMEASITHEYTRAADGTELWTSWK